jgi:rhodanese-related sulfurtransferase
MKIFNASVFKEILKILSLSILFAFVFNELSPTKLDLIYSPKNSNKPLSKNYSHLEFLNLLDSLKINGQKEPIGLEADYCYFLYKENLVSFLDIRHPMEYEQIRIMGAINLPFFEIEENSSILNSFIKDSAYVLYCDDEECGLSKKMGRLLIEKGFKYVFYMKGGIVEWKQKNYPIQVIEAY